MTAESIPDGTAHASGGAQRGKAVISLSVAAAVLIAGIALCVFGTREPAPARFRGTLAELLPTEAQLPGWHRERLPIAAAPETRAKIQEVLNFDDAVCGEFTHGSKRVSVYLAYWRPGKMSYRLVAGHTPDVCWTSAGWRTLRRESGVRFIADGHVLLPAERRTMQLGDAIEHVVYWHVAGGRVRSPGDAVRPRWHAALHDLFANPFEQRPEQWFVRVSSNDASLLTHAAFYRELLVE